MAALADWLFSVICRLTGEGKRWWLTLVFFAAAGVSATLGVVFASDFMPDFLEAFSVEDSWGQF